MKISVVHSNPCKHSLQETRKALMLCQSAAVNFPMYLQTQKTCLKPLNRRQRFICHQMFLLKVRSNIWFQKLILLQPSAQSILQCQISQVTSWQQGNKVCSFPAGKASSTILNVTLHVTSEETNSF